MTPNGPYGGFNPQAANYIQQQRFAAFQRQMQEMGNNSMQSGNRAMQYPTTSNNQPQSTEASNNTDSTPVSTMAPTQPNNAAKSTTPAPVSNENNLSRSNTPNKV